MPTCWHIYVKLNLETSYEIVMTPIPPCLETQAVILQIVNECSTLPTDRMSLHPGSNTHEAEICHTRGSGPE